MEMMGNFPMGRGFSGPAALWARGCGLAPGRGVRRLCRGGALGGGPVWKGGFCFFLECNSFVGDAPPSSFSPCAEKKKSAVHGGEEKEGFWVQTCNNLVSILLCSFVEHGAAWCPVVTLPVLLTALRAGAGIGRRAVRVFLQCVDCFNVQGCTVADLLHYASLSSVAAQCAGAGLGRCAVRRCVSFCCVSIA